MREKVCKDLVTEGELDTVFARRIFGEESEEQYLERQETRELATLNEDEVLRRQTCPILASSSASKRMSHTSKSSISPTNLLCPSGLARNNELFPPDVPFTSPRAQIVHQR